MTMRRRGYWDRSAAWRGPCHTVRPVRRSRALASPTADQAGKPDFRRCGAARRRTPDPTALGRPVRRRDRTHRVGQPVGPWRADRVLGDVAPGPVVVGLRKQERRVGSPRRGDVRRGDPWNIGQRCWAHLQTTSGRDVLAAPALPPSREEGGRHAPAIYAASLPNTAGSPRGGAARLGCRGSSGGTRGRRPLPSTSAQPSWVLRLWQGPHIRSMLSRVVSWTSVHGVRWSCWICRVCEHVRLVHHGEVQSRATRWAVLGPRPRWVTLTTSTPLVITSLRIASPNRLRATRAGTGPTPAMSQSSSPSFRPRTRASRSTRNNARKLGLGALGRAAFVAGAAGACGDAGTASGRESEFTDPMPARTRRASSMMASNA